jgi:hypothetical protein
MSSVIVVLRLSTPVSGGNAFRSRFGDGDPVTGVAKEQANSHHNGPPEPGDDLTISYNATEAFLKYARTRKAELMINGRKAWYGGSEGLTVTVDPGRSRRRSRWPAAG